MGGRGAASGISNKEAVFESKGYISAIKAAEKRYIKTRWKQQFFLTIKGIQSSQKALVRQMLCNSQQSNFQK